MILNKIPFFVLVCCNISYCFAQTSQLLDKKITAENTKRIITTLASNEMKGRKTFSVEIDKAAAFIVNEFKNIGLKPLGKTNGYLQSFSVTSATQTSISATVNGQPFDSTKVLIVTNQPEITVSQTSNYSIEKINASDNLNAKMSAMLKLKENKLVLVNESFAANFSRMGRLKRGFFPSGYTAIFILTNNEPSSYTFHATHKIEEKHLANVVGILPGKSKKEEYVIFSGHYDHLGTSNSATGDTIFNGANDDAAGTTAVIQLAKYYKALHNNQRTIVFATFTAEEIGGYGSQYFSRQFEPEKVVAMFNIEMIGTDSKWGNNSAYITGYEKTNMGEILQKNLTGTGFTFYPDPYTTQQLFYRSDNATLARLGVPAHTISTSKMDSEPNYHKVSDEVSTLDLENMNRIIKAVALSASSIIQGKDTPTRVNTSELR